ncbi:hypothetical protein CYY_004074 [Polysphondylium violaceum]|uniref:Uncharacterized protein n=1 Tax=Polysphondylium violaceum TaxID=133409 RepID=A0A8J4PVV1_9MYCE|nr:hypothetical protein CYY_004074 [Polysphondylium violaceum]
MQPQFQFGTFDARKYGYIRGRSILNSLINNQELEEWGVTDVQVISGHVALRFQQSRSICLFDATTSQFQLSDSVSNSLESQLLTKKFLDSPLSPSTQSLPILACSFPTNIIKFGFEKYIISSSSTNNNNNSNNSSSSSKSMINNNSTANTLMVESNPLRFYVFESDGTFHLWEWNTSEYKWKYTIKLFLPLVNRNIDHSSSSSGFGSNGSGNTSPIMSAVEANVRITNAFVFGSSQGISLAWIQVPNTTPPPLNLNSNNSNTTTPTTTTTTTTIYNRVLNFDQYVKKKPDLVSKQIIVRDSTSVKVGTGSNTTIDELYPTNLNITGLESYELKKEWSDEINGQENVRVLSTKLGIWFITGSFVLLWLLRNKMFNITFIKNSQHHQQSKDSLSLPTPQSCDIHGLISPPMNGNHHSINNEEKKQQPTPSLAKYIKDVLTVCKNPANQDLLILEPSGRLFSCEPSNEKEKLTVKLLAILELPSDKEQDVSMVMSQSALMFVDSKNAWFYDTKCGKLLSKTSLPLVMKKGGLLWQNGTAGVLWGCGVWAAGQGIYELRSLTPVTATIQSMASHKIQQQPTAAGGAGLHQHHGKTNASIGCAPTTCKQFDFRLMESKYLLDMALQEKDEQTKIEICKVLLPKLENPSLVIAILSDLESFQSCKFIFDQLGDFLEQYDYYEQLKKKQQPGGATTGGSATDEDEKSKNHKIRNSFFYHTPLNIKMIPMLKEYYRMQKLATAPITRLAATPANSISKCELDTQDWGLLGPLEQVDDPSILSVSHETIQVLVSKYPALLLQKLEWVLQIPTQEYTRFSDIYADPLSLPSPIINPLLFHSEESIYQAKGKEHLLAKTTSSSTPTLSSPSLLSAMMSDKPIQANYPIFETLCNLYYSTKPEHLVPFVRMIHHASLIKSLESDSSDVNSSYLSLNTNNNNNNSNNNNNNNNSNNNTNNSNNNNNTNNNSNNNNTNINNKIPEKDHFMRALLSIPILPPSPNQELQIDARFKLLIAIGHKPNALRFLLNIGKWDKALEMMKSVPYGDNETFVLYEILLSFCIERKDSVKLKQCWDIIPKNFSVFNLLSLLKPFSNTLKNNNNNNSLNQNNSNNNNNNNNNSSSGSRINTSNSINNNNNPPIYNPIVLSTPNNSDGLTIDMFKGQILKMLNLDTPKRNHSTFYSMKSINTKEINIL